MIQERKNTVLNVAELYNKFLGMFGMNNRFAPAAYFEGTKNLFSTWEEWDLLWNELSEPKLMAMLIPQMASTAKTREQLVITMSRCPKNHGASKIVRMKIKTMFRNQIPELKEEVEKYFLEHEKELPSKVGKLTLKLWVLNTFLYGQTVEIGQKARDINTEE